jgi:hypothetical protein
MPIYLYVKTHNITNVKYLGKTKNIDPHTYKGSGIDWKAHLKEYGADYTTEIIRECHTTQELNEWGRYYSKLWNVVESKDWANRIPETGGGSCSRETAKKISDRLIGIKKPIRTDNHKQNLSKSCSGISKPRSAEHQLNLNKSSKSNWATNTLRKTQIAELGKTNKGRKHTPEALEKKRLAMLEYWKAKRLQDL